MAAKIGIFEERPSPIANSQESKSGPGIRQLNLSSSALFSHGCLTPAFPLFSLLSLSDIVAQY